MTHYDAAPPPASSKIAVIGSGIAGMSAAWLLSKSRQVTLFEKAARIGGHTNTLLANTPDGSAPVDTGFIVYNKINYPNLTALFSHLGVPTQVSDMGFAVSIGRGQMEYSGKHLAGLFGQRRNLVRVEHWQLVADILRFFREAERQVATVGGDVSIGAFLERFGYSRVFIEDHILPMSAAIWSTPARSMLDFPATTFVAFFANHGLLKIGNDRHVWHTVKGGAQQYVDRLVSNANFTSRTDAGIVSVIRHVSGAELFFADGSREHFDEVVFACHADQALALLGDVSDDERNVLGAFRSVPNRAVLHSDESFMPKRRHLWSAWNYLRQARSHDSALSVTYWMNRLQPLATKTNLFVTLNPAHDFAPGTVLHDIAYEHPLFDERAIAAQSEIWRVQGKRRTWFAGAWLGYGFHEDGLQSGLEVAERLGDVARPWSVDAERGRIAHNWAGEFPPLQMAAE